MPEIEMSSISRNLVEKYGFEVTSSGDRYVVRDAQNRKLGKGGRLEGGNLESLLFAAEDARKSTAKATVASFVASRKKSAATPVAAKKEPSQKASNAPKTPRAPKAEKPAKPTRDMSAMNAVYLAVINGMAPGDVFTVLTSEGINLKSETSTYTHANIGKRVIDLARANGWRPPEKKEE